MAFLLSDLPVGTSFRIKGDSSIYVVDGVDSGFIVATNKATGTSGKIPTQNVIEIVNVAQSEVSDIKIVEPTKADVKEAVKAVKRSRKLRK